MKKKIKVIELQSGMYLSGICGSWLDHPFWKSEFILKMEDINLLKRTGIQEVWVDSLKGLDPDIFNKNNKFEKNNPYNNDINKNLIVIKNKERPILKSSLSDEINNAKNIVNNASKQVKVLFNDIRMGKAFNEEMAMSIVDEISTSLLRNSDALISISRLKNKDTYTYIHSVAVCALMVTLGKALGYDNDFCKKAGAAGLLHDIGKIFIPLDVLNKPGKLTNEEFEEVKNHPVKGWELLKDIEGINEETLEVCLHHHEKVDGSGYPSKYKGEEISIIARMGAICDVYDAITSDRAYKKGWEPSSAIKSMSEWEGHFDPDLLRVFISSIGIYPVGSLVKLKSGKVGVVIEKGEKSLLMPKVKIFFSTKTNMRIIPKILDLSKPNINESIECNENPSHYNFINIYDLLSD